MNRIKKSIIKATAPLRRRMLNNDDFTIISNNCWAGDVYRYVGLPYLTPTVGLYFFADEYIRFLSDLPRYFGSSLERVDISESKYKEELIKRNQQDKIIARIEDVEIVMLHYSTWESAKNDWERRAARINFDNLIVKFSRQNLCTEQNVQQFFKMPYEKKLYFDNRPFDNPNAVYISGFDGNDYLPDDIKNYRKHMNIIKFLNTGKVK